MPDGRDRPTFRLSHDPLLIRAALDRYDARLEELAAEHGDISKWPTLDYARLISMKHGIDICLQANWQQIHREADRLASAGITFPPPSPDPAGD